MLRPFLECRWALSHFLASFFHTLQSNPVGAGRPYHEGRRQRHGIQSDTIPQSADVPSA